jgi:hypothetical protein
MISNNVYNDNTIQNDFHNKILNINIIFFKLRV